MTAPQPILLLGGTGRTGGRVLEQLLDQGEAVRAIVRSAKRLPATCSEHPALEVIEADLLSLDEPTLKEHVRGCRAIVSCLGHQITMKGIFGPPRQLVTQAVTNLCRAVESVQPGTPVKFVLMGSVSVNQPDGLEPGRSGLERAFLAVIRLLVPPAKDNQTAADFLFRKIGPSNPFVQWVVVRPDTLMTGDVSSFAVHEHPVNSLFSAGKTNMANVARFICQLLSDGATWEAWRGKLPVVVNTTPAKD